MTILTGLIIAFLMLVVLEAIERTMPTSYDGGLGLFPFLIIAMSIMIGWQLNEYIVTKWFNDVYSTGVISRILQVIHAAGAALIAYKGFGIGVIIFLFVLLKNGLSWLLFG